MGNERDRGIGGLKDRGREERDAGEEKELDNLRDIAVDEVGRKGEGGRERLLYGR